MLLSISISLLFPFWAGLLCQSLGLARARGRDGHRGRRAQRAHGGARATLDVATYPHPHAIPDRPHVSLLPPLARQTALRQQRRRERPSRAEAPPRDQRLGGAQGAQSRRSCEPPPQLRSPSAAPVPMPRGSITFRCGPLNKINLPGQEASFQEPNSNQQTSHL